MTGHKKQPEALRLADLIDQYNTGVCSQAIYEDYARAAAELRRLHAECEALRQNVKAWQSEHKKAILTVCALQNECEALRAELDAQRVYARVLCKAVDAATDFAGTVAGGASWWDDVWADHAAALDRARNRISDAARAAIKEQPNE